MNDVQRLKEMGIPVWELRRPELYSGIAAQDIVLPQTCQILLVSDSLPNQQDAWLFGKILASMKLVPEQARQLPPSALPLIKQHALKWVWFCGTSAQSLDGAWVLSSPSLAVLQHDQAAKKALWQQIKRYDN